MFLLSQNFLPWLIRRRISPKYRHGSVIFDTLKWIVVIQPAIAILVAGLCLASGAFLEFICFYSFEPDWTPSFLACIVISVLGAIINIQLFRTWRENWRLTHEAVFVMEILIPRSAISIAPTTE